MLALSHAWLGSACAHIGHTITLYNRTTPLAKCALQDHTLAELGELIFPSHILAAGD